MADWVLDASAVLALMRSEPGADRVIAALPTSVIASVNAAEVVTRLIQEGFDPAPATLAFRRLGCPVAPIDEALGLRAGALASLTAGAGLSLGDRCCLALAEREQVPALTADRQWARIALPMSVALIR
jgi:PIN domain nuclease of toxin-antitoxin system